MLAMVEIMRGIRVRLTMSKFLWLHRDPKWFAAVQAVHQFMDKHIDQAFEERHALKASTGTDSTAGSSRTDLLWDLTAQFEPSQKKLLRDQITAVWVPSNETTSIHISNAIYCLARHPQAWQKLQSEVEALSDEPLTFSRLRGMKYLTGVINESMHSPLSQGKC
jgi:cytochrome P450 monooxygenase